MFWIVLLNKNLIGRFVIKHPINKNSISLTSEIVCYYMRVFTVFLYFCCGVVGQNCMLRLVVVSGHDRAKKCYCSIPGTSALRLESLNANSGKTLIRPPASVKIHVKQQSLICLLTSSLVLD